MPYMGKVDVKASDIRRFDVTGSTSATHTLSWTAPSEQALIITINGVKQQDSAYTISGSPTTITLASALVATDEMEVIGINDIGQTNTVAQDSIVTDMIRDDAVTTAKIADDQVTSAKLDTNIVIDGTFDVGSYLSVDSSGRVTMPSQVCFTATNVAGSLTTVTAGNPYPFNTVHTNVGNHFNTSNYRFTAPVDGNYFLQCFILVNNSNNVSDMRLYVNGSNTGIAGYGDGLFSGAWMKGVCCAILNLNANDYVYFAAQNTQSFHNGGAGSSEHSQFIGYLIG